MSGKFVLAVGLVFVTIPVGNFYGNHILQKEAEVSKNSTIKRQHLSEESLEEQARSFE